MSEARVLRVTVVVLAVTLIFGAWTHSPMQSVTAMESGSEPTIPAMTHSEPVAAAKGVEEAREAPAGVAPAAQTSTLPVRWRIPFAHHQNPGTLDAINCATVVSVVGFGQQSINVEVEFFGQTGASVGLSSSLLNPASEPDQHVTNSDIQSEGGVEPFGPFGDMPTSANPSANTETFVGYALVTADDPRIFVGAYLVCNEEGVSGVAFPRLLTNLSAYPVGATATYFQAGMPAMASSPVAGLPGR